MPLDWNSFVNEADPQVSGDFAAVTKERLNLVQVKFKW